MSPISLITVLLSVWVLLNFWLYPLTKDRWSASDLKQKMLRAGTLVVMEKLRDLAAIGSITLSIVVIVIWIAERLAGSNVVLPAVLLAAIARSHGTLKGFAENYGLACSVAGFAGVALTLYYTSRLARRRVATAWGDKAAEVRERLASDLGAALEALDAKPELQEMSQRIRQLAGKLIRHQEVLEQVSAAGQPPETWPEGLLHQVSVEELQQELSSLISYASIEVSKDEVEFPTALATPAEGEVDAPPTWRNRIGRILASAQLGKDIGLIKKPVSFAVTGLLFVSLLSWSSEPLAEGMQHALNKLQVNASAVDAEANLANSLRKVKATPEEATGNDQAVRDLSYQAASQAIARAATHAMLRSNLLQRAVGLEHSGTSQRELIGHLINSRTVDASGADPVAATRKELAEQLERGGIQEPPDRMVRKVRDVIEPDLQAMHKEQPRRFAALAAALDERYAKGISPLDAQGKLLEKMLDLVFDAVDAKPSGELGKQAHKLTKEFGKDALKTWMDAQARNFVASALADAARSDVVQRMSAAKPFEMSQRSREFVQELHHSGNASWTANAAERNEAAMARAVATRIAQHHNMPPGQDASEMLERLSGYDGFFSNGSQKPTASHTRPGGPPARWSSFHVAARSARVRGVLFGREIPEEIRLMDDIRWQGHAARPGGTASVSIDIRSGPSWKALGQFPAAVVNQALRFAADGRVIATTITPGDGKITNRLTMLHPSLVDTPLGCRVIEADRIVDAVTFNWIINKPSPAFVQLSEDREQSGTWRRVIGLAQAVAEVPRSQHCPVEELDEAIKTLKLKSVGPQVMFSQDLTSTFDRFLNKLEQSRAGSTAFLRKADACAKSSQPLSACLCDKVMGSAGSSYWIPVDHTSQFRERLSGQEQRGQWLQPSKDRLAHAELWVHTTFQLQQSYLVGDHEAESAAMDFPQSELSALRTTVAATLPLYISKHLRSPSYDDFMAPLEQFILLQRLFRSVLHRKAGDEFPAHKLLALQQQTAASVPFQPTMRWEPVDGRSEAFKDFLRSAHPAAEAAYTKWQQDHATRREAGKPVCAAVSH